MKLNQGELKLKMRKKKMFLIGNYILLWNRATSEEIEVRLRQLNKIIQTTQIE